MLRATYIHTVIHNTTVVHAHATDAMMKWGRGIFKKLSKNILLDYYRWDISDISVELLAPNVRYYLCATVHLLMRTPRHNVCVYTGHTHVNSPQLVEQNIQFVQHVIRGMKL